MSTERYHHSIAPHPPVGHSLSFPPERRSLARMISYLVHRRRVEQPAVHHHIPHVVRVLDVHERVRIEHYEVSFHV